MRKVGIFVNAAAPAVEDTMRRVGLDLVQLHGDEDPAYCEAFAGRYIRAFRVETAADLRALESYSTDTVLLDEMVSELNKNGGKVSAAVQAIVRSPQFRMVRGSEFGE